MYPDPSELRAVSHKIACGIIRQVRDDQVGRIIRHDRIEELVAESMWFPDYETSGEKEI